MRVVASLDCSADALSVYKLNFSAHVACVEVGPERPDFTFPEPRERLHIHLSPHRAKSSRTPSVALAPSWGSRCCDGAWRWAPSTTPSPFGDRLHGRDARVRKGAGDGKSDLRRLRHLRFSKLWCRPDARAPHYRNAGDHPPPQRGACIGALLRHRRLPRRGRSDSGGRDARSEQLPEQGRQQHPPDPGAQKISLMATNAFSLASSRISSSDSRLSSLTYFSYFFISFHEHVLFSQAETHFSALSALFAPLSPSPPTSLSTLKYKTFLYNPPDSSSARHSTNCHGPRGPGSHRRAHLEVTLIHRP